MDSNFKYSKQKLESMEAIGLKPKPLIVDERSSDTNDNIDIIEAEIKLKTKNRNTFINSCLTGEINYLNPKEIANHATNFDLKKFKNHQLIYAPTGVGKTTLFVFEMLYKLTSNDSNLILFLAPSTDLIPETSDRLKRVLTSYLFDEDPKFNDTYLKHIDVFSKMGTRKERLEFFLEKNLDLVKCINSDSGKPIVAESYFHEEEATDRLIKPELLNAFNRAIQKSESTRTVEQKQIIRMLDAVIHNKFTLALAPERNKREGKKIMGFFRNTPNVKTGAQFLRNLEMWGHPSHVIFMAYPGYLSSSERHILFTPQLQIILNYVRKVSRFSQLCQNLNVKDSSLKKRKYGQKHYYSSRVNAILRIDEIDSFESSYTDKLLINMPYKIKERKYLMSLGTKAKQGLKYGALVGTDMLAYPAINFKSIQRKQEIETVFRDPLSLVEPSFDNIEKLKKIQRAEQKTRSGNSIFRSDIVFRDGLILKIETGEKLLVDGNSICKTVTRISIYDNSLGKFIDVVKNPSLFGRNNKTRYPNNLTSKISLIPDVNNINWLIHSQKGSGKDDSEIVQGVLQVILRRILTSTNTFILSNVAVKRTTLFQKEANKLNVKTISDLMVLSFDEAKLIYNEYWGKLSTAEKKNRPVSNWIAGPDVGIWFEESLMTTNGFFYQTFINHFNDINGFSATDHEFFRKSFYNQIAPIEYLLEAGQYDLIGKIFGLSRKDFCSLPGNFLRFIDNEQGFK